MPINRRAAKAYLKQFDFESLMLEELGWDSADPMPIQVRVGDRDYTLHAVAQKRGMTFYHCSADPASGDLPDRATRSRIDRQVTAFAREHIIVYSDARHQEQVWQWVRRELGKPIASREQRYAVIQDGEALLQKLEGIAFSLAEEEQLALLDVADRVRKAFDRVDRITKKFYERFKKEHGQFLQFITGIQASFDREWYCSLMLNRLMFVYFIQRKGFLDGDINYLQNRLQRCQQSQGDAERNAKNAVEFYSFYRYFLLRLFHDGLGSSRRDDPELRTLLGNIPYLNGGLFELHHLEATYPHIQIPDEAFQRIFQFFDEYDWHLDDRPLRNDREINPDVLGYIFEKYINQKQMGAYYTKEDITEYISKNTILPFLFDAAREKYLAAFTPLFQGEGGAEGEGSDTESIWQLLQENPDRYIYDAVRQGVDVALPLEIEAGIEDVSQRGNWNQSAPEPFALPTETWREHVARRQRCQGLRRKLAAGEICHINDLITDNLDIRQFAQDVLDTCNDPDLLRAFWKAINQVSVLDPTCGSGAFLFAALNILEPLYEACLDRMDGFMADLARSPQSHSPKKFEDFRKVLDEAAKHPNRRYFILKSIILNNLYGVDIMEEATEICKLRLFLKLVAQVDANSSQPNYGLEPLPDIDFNIRAGNTLVGFASLAEVRTAIEREGIKSKGSKGSAIEADQFKLDLMDDATRIDEAAEIADRAFQQFRTMQTKQGMDSAQFATAKHTLRDRLRALNQELNQYLAREYGIDTSKAPEFQKWCDSHQPFHWFVEFYGAIKRGGFDVIIGNPPYVEISKVKSYKFLGYNTEGCGNIYAPCIERASSLIARKGTFGMIVPLSGFFTDRMKSYQDLVYTRFSSLHISYYSGDAHPSVLFTGVKYRLCIILAIRQEKNSFRKVFSSSYMRWYADERDTLFKRLYYNQNLHLEGFLKFAKTGNPLAGSILDKILKKDLRIKEYIRKSGNHKINYHRSPVFWIRSMNFEPYFKSPVKDRSTDHLKDLFFDDENTATAVSAILNSTCFYYWFSIQGNCRNIAGFDIESFPVGKINRDIQNPLRQTFSTLMKDLQRNSKRRVYNYKHSGKVEYDEFYPSKSKPIIDEIDRTLAKHYGFTDEELDFIINYDIKYRMGRDSKGGE